MRVDWLGNVTFLAAVLAAASVTAHPTDAELREQWQNRQRCESTTPWPERIDSIRLGTSQAEVASAIAEPAPDSKKASPATPSPKRESADGPIRLERKALGVLSKIEYELWNDQVYRIRWRLGQQFERPVLEELVRRAQTCFGLPEYDQTFEAEPGMADATFRRVGWAHEDRRIELRQLHPLRGGGVYLTVSSQDAVRQLGLAGLAPFPDPTTSEPWWRRSVAPLSPVEPPERKRLGSAFMDVLSQLDH